MWRYKLRGLAACAVVWCVAGILADEEPEWAQWYHQGETHLADKFGPLPVEISGKNFTLERLEMYFTLTLAEHRATKVEEFSVEQPVDEEQNVSTGASAQSITSFSFRGMQNFCFYSSACKAFYENPGNADKDYHRLLEVNVGAIAYGWNQLQNWKPKRKLHGAYVAFENLLGMNVVEVWYDWEFYYGGQIANGGAFIRAATPIVKFETGVFHYVDIKARARATRNAGTIYAPIAAIDLEIEFLTSVGTMTCMATVQGDGTSWVHSGCPGYPTPADPSVDARIPTPAPTDALSKPEDAVVTAMTLTGIIAIAVICVILGIVAIMRVKLSKRVKYGVTARVRV